MTKHLSKENKSLSEADETLNIDYVMDLSQPKPYDPSTFSSPERSPKSSSIPLSPAWQYETDTPKPIENLVQDSTNTEESIDRDIIHEELDQSSIDLSESGLSLDNHTLGLVNSTMSNLSLAYISYLSLESSKDDQSEVNSSHSLLDDGNTSIRYMHLVIANLFHNCGLTFQVMTVWKLKLY